MGLFSFLTGANQSNSDFDSNEIIQAIRSNDFDRLARVCVDNLSLLKFEDRLNKIESDRQTFLSRLLMNGQHMEFAKVVMCFGARIDIMLPSGKKVWQMNTNEKLTNYLGMINYIIENLTANDVLAQGAGRVSHTALTWMVKLGYYYGLKHFLAMKGMNPNLCYGNKITPLMIATEMSYPHFIDMLVSYGANPDQSDEDGWSALSYAAANRNRYPNNLALVAKRLIKNGANINHKNEKGQTPLALAIKNGNDVVATILRESGAVV